MNIEAEPATNVTEEQLTIKITNLGTLLNSSKPTDVTIQARITPEGGVGEPHVVNPKVTNIGYGTASTWIALPQDVLNAHGSTWQIEYTIQVVGKETQMASCYITIANNI